MRRPPPSSAVAPADEIDPACMLAALRDAGADRHDPVRFRFIEALARRAATHAGVARRRLDERLAQAITAYSERFAAVDPPASVPLASPPGVEVAPGPLAGLLAHIRAHQPPAREVSQADAAPVGMATAIELKAVTYFKEEWSKLRVDQQLAQSLAKVPDNAGPFNAHLLAVRSLQLMSDIAPAYLKDFLSYLDALIWLEQADNGSRAAQRNTGGREKRKKTVRANASSGGPEESA